MSAWARRSEGSGSRAPKPTSPVAVVMVACGVLLAGSVQGRPADTGADTRLDALVARVDGRMLTLSDIRLMRDLGLVAASLPDDAVLSWLVDRTLMLADLARFQPPDPAAARVNDVLAVLRSKVGADAWRSALRRAGVDEDYAWALARDSVRLENYQRERFGPLAEPTDEDVREAHRLQQAALPPGTPPVAFDSAAPALRAELRARRFDALVATWTTELRTRGEVRLNAGQSGVSR